MCSPFCVISPGHGERGERVCVFTLTRWMNPAAVSHVLMKMEHRFTSLMELLWETRVTSHLSKWNASHWRTDQSVIYWAQHTHTSVALPWRCSMGVNTGYQKINQKTVGFRGWPTHIGAVKSKGAFTLAVSTRMRYLCHVGMNFALNSCHLK